MASAHGSHQLLLGIGHYPLDPSVREHDGLGMAAPDELFGAVEARRMPPAHVVLNPPVISDLNFHTVILYSMSER